MLLSDYPGYERGMARMQRVEDVLRAFAMTPLLERINGISVRQLTPRMFDLLFLISSPFLVSPAKRRQFGLRARPEDVAQFLWIVSPGNPLDSSPPPKNFFANLRPDEPAYFRQFYRAIDRYFDRAMLDRPAGAIGGRVVSTSFTASVVNRIAGAYGWPAEVFSTPPAPARTPRTRTRAPAPARARAHDRLPSRPIPDAGILDMPIARLFQYWRWISVDRNPETPLFSRFQDSFRKRTILKWRARAVAAGFGADITTADVRAYLISIGKLSQRSEVRSQKTAPVS
jgi:hypothetical protein